MTYNDEKLERAPSERRKFWLILGKSVENTSSNKANISLYFFHNQLDVVSVYSGTRTLTLVVLDPQRTPSEPGPHLGLPLPRLVLGERLADGALHIADRVGGRAEDAHGHELLGGELLLEYGEGFLVRVLGGLQPSNVAVKVKVSGC